MNDSLAGTSLFGTAHLVTDDAWPEPGSDDSRTGGSPLWYDTGDVAPPLVGLDGGRLFADPFGDPPPGSSLFDGGAGSDGEALGETSGDGSTVHAPLFGNAGFGETLFGDGSDSPFGEFAPDVSASPNGIVASGGGGDGESVPDYRAENIARFSDPENLELPAAGEVDVPHPHDPADERALTPDEATHLRELFGPELDTDAIRLVDGTARPGEGLYAAEAWLGADGVTTIYLGSKMWSENFLHEKAGSRERSTFYHEVYHAAQYQNVVNGNDTGADVWDRDFAINTEYDDALIWSGIDTDETSVEESAVIFEASLEAVQTGEDVNDILEGYGFSVEEDASAEALLGRFTDGAYEPGDAYVPPPPDDD